MKHRIVINTPCARPTQKSVCRTKKIFTLLLTLYSATTSLFVSCNGGQQQQNANTGPQAYPVYTVKSAPTTLHVQYPATLEGQQDIDIRPKIDGYIQQILVNEGAMVRKGQLLFVINAPQYEQEVRTATAAIQSAEAEVSAARIQVSNLEPLVQKEIVTSSALETARYTLKSKQALLAQAKASLANARTNTGYTHIVSPINGVVGTIPNKVGSLVSPSAAEPLTKVSQIQSIHAYFSMDEKEFLAFTAKYKGKTMTEKLKQMPAVNLILSDGTTYSEKGRVETINGLIDRATGSISFRATFPNPNGTIRSGGSATLDIPANIGSALLLPQSTTFEMQGKKMVYTVDPKGMVKGREIKVKELGSGTDYVIEDGLKEGDKVVAEGMGNLKDSTVIKPVPTDPATKKQ